MFMLTEWKCPQGHLIVATTWDDTEMDRDQVVAGVGVAFERGLISRNCGICGGGLVIESRKIEADTWETAIMQMRKQAIIEDQVRKVHLRRN